MCKYNIQQMLFDLHVENNSKYIQGSVTINGVTASALDTFAFRLHSNHTIDSLFINNIKQDSIHRNGHEVRVALITTLVAGATFSAQVYYHGTAPGVSQTWGEGLVTDTSSTGKHYTYTLSCPYFMYEWAPCKEVLDDFIDSVQMSITTDSTNKVGSNGLMQSDSVVAGGKHKVTWVTHYPINYYLISFNVGAYLVYKTNCNIGTNPSFPIINFVYDSTRLSSKKNIYDTLSYFLQHYSDIFSTYPFYKEKFGTCMTQLAGGMEHQTFVNLGINYLTKYLAAHEMSHQWWGDNVVLKSLADVWLNEGFASYCEYLTSEYFYPGEHIAYLNNKYADAIAAGSVSRVYRTDTTSFANIYNYNEVYEKGAIILHTLRYVINNDTLFFSALAHYQKKFAHKNVVLSDFKGYMESYTGVSLDTFFNQWFYGYGYPVYDIKWNEWNHTLMIVLKHKGSCGLTPLFITPLELKLTRSAAADTVIKVKQKTNNDTFYIDTHGTTVTSLSVDPYMHVLNHVRTNIHDITLGVDTVANAEKIYFTPTLFNTTLSIYRGSNKPVDIWVYDINGRLVYNESINTKAYCINTSAWRAGMYLVKAVYDNTVLVSKVIKEI